MKIRLLAALLIAGGAVQPALAADPSMTFRHGAAAAVVAADYLFSEPERRVLRDFLRHSGGDDGPSRGSEKGPGKAKPLPPGLQKKLARGGSLPPGWQKKLVRGEVLDPGLYALSGTLPGDVLARLPRGPAGTSIRRLEDRVVRLMDATGVILDVLGGY